MEEEKNVDFSNLNNDNIQKFFEDKFINNQNQKLTEEQFYSDLKKMLKPDISSNSNEFSTDSIYIPKTSDPYKRLIQLKNELLSTKKEIDDNINNYNNISYLMNINNNYSNLYKNIQQCKNKIDSLIDYNLISTINEYDSDSDNEEKTEIDNSKSSQNKLKMETITRKREENEKKLKKEEEENDIIFQDDLNLNSIYEKYNRISEHLLTKIKLMENDINSVTKYTICGNSENKLNILSNKIIELELSISKIENIIGNYDFNFIKNTICGSLNYLLTYAEEVSKNKEDKDKREKINFDRIKDLDCKLNSYCEGDNIKLGKIYLLLVKGYMIYKTMKKFEDIVSYLKKRINTINNIILNSEQFNDDMKLLNEYINKNEINYGLLKYKYFQTLEAFSNIEGILKEVNELDNLVNKKI